MKTYFRSRILPTPEETADILTRDFIRYTDEMLRFRDKLYIAVSGGSTPNLLFNLLATEYPLALQWEKLHFFWVDERCVPHGHVESNYGNALQICFSKVAIPQANLHPVFGGDNPNNEVVRYTGDILAHVPCTNGFPVFDLILLGLGEDGHTASIFPGQEQLFEVKTIASVSENPISGQKRITLTGNVLNNAANVIFLVTGSKKRMVIQEITQNHKSGSVYPASHVHPKTGDLFWYLDKAAAGDLTEATFY